MCVGATNCVKGVDKMAQYMSNKREKQTNKRGQNNKKALRH